MLQILLGTLLGIGLFMACELCMRGLVRFRRPIVYKWEWKPIDKFPIPEYDSKNPLAMILVSNGEESYATYIDYLTFNAKGQQLYGFEKMIITHWAYMPSLPFKFKGE